MSPHTVLLCDTGHYSPYYSQPFTTLITWKILQPIVQKSLRERNMWLCVFIFFALEQKTERNRTTAHTSWRRKSHQKMLWNTIAQNAHHIVVYHHLYSPCFQGGGVWLAVSSQVRQVGQYRGRERQMLSPLDQTQMDTPRKNWLDDLQQKDSKNSLEVKHIQTAGWKYPCVVYKVREIFFFPMDNTALLSHWLRHMRWWKRFKMAIPTCCTWI